MFGVIWRCSIAVGLAAVFGGVSAGDDPVAAGCEDLGGLIEGPALEPLAGLVKANRRLSRSPMVGLSGCSKST